MGLRKEEVLVGCSLGLGAQGELLGVCRRTRVTRVCPCEVPTSSQIHRDRKKQSCLARGRGVGCTQGWFGGRRNVLESVVTPLGDVMACELCLSEVVVKNQGRVPMQHEPVSTTSFLLGLPLRDVWSHVRPQEWPRPLECVADVEPHCRPVLLFYPCRVRAPSPRAS